MAGLRIETERLVLRRFSRDDVADLLAVVRHPSVSRAAPEIGATEAEVGRYVDAQGALEPFPQDACFDLAIALKDGGRVIGLLSLVRRAHTKAELGYALDVRERGRGYATEAASALVGYAFGTLGLHRIEAITGSHNPASYRVMERLGMRREAWLREAEFRDGEWRDVLIYGLLARDWRAGAPD